VNLAPRVTAGPNRRVALPATIQLAGFAQDDGVPSAVTAAWTQLSGPDTVTFSDPSQIQPVATFPALGTYVLQLSVTDGEYSASSTTTVTVVDGSLQTSLTLNSDELDFIGQGYSYADNLLTGAFSVSYAPGGGVTIVYDADPPDPLSLGNHWKIFLAAPAGEPLAVGTYDGTTTSASETLPALDVNDVTFVSGTFTVKKIVYGPGNTILSLWATFVARRDASDGSLHGEIKFNAGDTEASTNQAPGAYAGPDAQVVIPRTITLSGVAGDDGLPNGTLTTTWSKLSGPGTVTFADPSQLQTTASFSAPGSYVLQLTASDGALSTISTLAVTAAPTPNDSLMIASEAGDKAGGGQIYQYTFADGDFTATRYGNGVAITFGEPQSPASWGLVFAGPGSLPLGVGRYAQARSGEGTGLDPYLAVTRRNASFSVATGSFQVYEATYAADGSVLTFDATFEQHVSGGVPALRGEVKYQAASTASHLSLPLLVYAGDNVLATGQTLSLTGVVLGEAFSQGPVVTTWSQVSGPSAATFADPSALATTVTFPRSGSYVLQLLAHDNTRSALDHLTVVVPEESGATSLAIHSDPGDPFGNGQDYFYTPADGTFDVNGFFTGEITINFATQPENQPRWFLEFYNANSRPFGPGTFYVTGKPPLPGESPPFAYVAMPTVPPQDATGQFSVYEAVYAADGTLLAFHATFDQYAVGNSAGLHGEIKYHASTGNVSGNLPPSVLAGGDVHLTLGQPLNLAGAASDDGVPAALRTTWSLLSGPGTVKFAHASAVQTQATFSASGTYVLQLTGTDGQYSATDRLTVFVFDPNERTSLSLESDRGNFMLDRRQTCLFLPADGDLEVTEDLNIVQTTFSTPDGSDQWSIGFLAPEGAQLTPGAYAHATYLDRFSINSLNNPSPQLYVIGNERDPGGIGDFTVQEIVRGSYGKILSFQATFTYRASAGAPALRGEIRYHAPLGPAGATPTVYRGNVYTINGVAIGLLRLQVTGDGRAIGTIILPGKTYTFTGTYDGGHFETLIGASEQAGITVLIDPNLDGSLSAQFISVNTDLVSGTMELARSPTVAVFPARLAGQYALAMTGTDPSARNLAWGILSVTTQGQATLIGKAPDGTPFSYGTSATPGGTVVMNVRVPSNRTTLAGILDLRATADSDVSGTLSWTRRDPDRSGEGVYIDVVGDWLVTQGSRIKIVAANAEPLTGSTQPVAVTATMDGGLPDGPETHSLYLRGRSSFPFQAGDPPFSVQARRNGVFTGRFLSASGNTIPFDGIILEKIHRGFGRFGRASENGMVKLAPAAP
jgi:hypothetical protein